MQQTAAFLDALKRSLKAKGMTYRDLAPRFGLSEASVKRIFAGGSLSLEQIGIVLEALGTTFLDVAKLARPSADDERDVLTFDQESVLAADAALFTVFHLLLFGSTSEQIVAAYEISADAVERHVERLRDLRLLEARRGGGVKMLKSRTIRWRDDGPLRAAYEDRIRSDFLKRSFDGAGDVLTFRTRTLSPSSQALLKRRLEQVMAELDDLSSVDAAVVKGQTRAIALMVAFGPFATSAIAGLRKRRGG